MSTVKDFTSKIVTNSIKDLTCKIISPFRTSVAEIIMHSFQAFACSMISGIDIYNFI